MLLRTNVFLFRSISVYLYPELIGFSFDFRMIKVKEGFKGERSVSLPEELLSEYAREPLVGNLYLRKIGFFPKAKFHYVQKPEGADYAMLIYCTEGEGWCVLNGQRYRIVKNHYMFIPSGTPYSFGSDEQNPWTIYWMHFRGELASQFIPRTALGPISILPGESSRLQDRIDLFEELYQCFSMGYMKEYMIYSSMCLYQFLASFAWLEQYRHSRIPEHKEYPLSSKVLHYMEEHIGQDISLAEMAAYFKYSPSHFSMLFQRETGVSPIAYFIRLKIRKACQYIELTNLKLTEIATKLGFEEQAYFSRIFTKVMGMSPSAYRKRESEFRHGEAEE